MHMPLRHLTFNLTAAVAKKPSEDPNPTMHQLLKCLLSIKDQYSTTLYGRRARRLMRGNYLLVITARVVG